MKQQLAWLRAAATRRNLKPALAFMHVPKAAGTTIMSEIDLHLRPRRVTYVLDGTQFGGFQDFATMSPGIRAGIVLSPAQITDNADVLAGHIGLSTILARYPLAKRATVLREPTTRLMSQWLYFGDYSDETAALFGTWSEVIKLARLDLANFAVQPRIACLIDNTVTRMLLWPHPLIPDVGFIDPRHDAELMDAALAALDRFDYLDVAENPRRAQAFADWLRRCYGRSIWVNVKAMVVREEAPRLNERQAGQFDPLALERQIEEAAPALAARTRLDNPLWRHALNSRMAGQNAEIVAAEALARTLDRYGTAHDRAAGSQANGPARSPVILGV